MQRHLLTVSVWVFFRARWHKPKARVKSEQLGPRIHHTEPQRIASTTDTPRLRHRDEPPCITAPLYLRVNRQHPKITSRRVSNVNRAHHDALMLKHKKNALLGQRFNLSTSR